MTKEALCSDKVVILACSAAEHFAQRVIAHLNKQVGKDCRFSLGTLKTIVFPDYEISARLNVSVSGKSVHLFQCFRMGFIGFHQDLTELLVVLDALKRSGAQQVTIHLPYLPFQRQEKKTEGREPISARLIFDLIETAAGDCLSRYVTTDLHTAGSVGYSNKPIDNLTCWPLFVLYAKQVLKLDPDEIVVVHPDVGGNKRSGVFAKHLGSDVAVIQKKRVAGEIEECKLIGNVNRYAIIIDDIISSAGTIISAKDVLIKLGVEKVFAFASHGIFNKKNGVEAEKRLFDAGISVITTDAIPEKFTSTEHGEGYWKSCFRWLDAILSLSRYYADCIRCRETAESFAEQMFKYEQMSKDNTGNISDFIICSNRVI